MFSVNEFCGLLVKQAREEKSWTQQDLADEVDMDVRTIKKIEEGNASPYYLTIEKLVYALNISPNIMCHAEQSEKGLFMDKLYRQLFSLDAESLKIVCDSAIYIRNWHDKHDGKDNDISEQDAHAPEMWRYSPGEKHRPQMREGAQYTPTEKEEIEKVIAIFAQYIKDSPYADIVWSDKLGYVFLNIDLGNSSIEMEPTIIMNAEGLIQQLLSEISNDVMDNTSHEFSLAEAPLEVQQEIRRRFGEYLDKLPEYHYVADEMFKAQG